MRNKIITLCFALIPGYVLAQSGSFIMLNATNCDIVIEVLADETSLTACVLVTPPIYISAFSSTAFSSDHCVFEGAYGWMGSPGSVCPAPLSTFKYTNIKIGILTCPTAAPPSYTVPSPNNGEYVRTSTAGACAVAGSGAAPYSPTGWGGPTINIIESGTTPIDLIVVLN